MGENTERAQAFKLKGRLYTLTVLQVMTTDKDVFSEQCAQIVARAPKWFDRTPVVFDLSTVGQEDFDVQALLQVAREHGMVPVAVQGASPLIETAMHANRLAILKASDTQDRPVFEQQADAVSAGSVQSKLITTPVRSGQQVVAKGGDLIVTSSVSHGAELLADGSIHVYGALRGRALAGLSGDLEARIFCQSLEAELVSIAGYYRLSDAIEPMNRPCQIFLKNEHIVIESL